MGKDKKKKESKEKSRASERSRMEDSDSDTKPQKKDEQRKDGKDKVEEKEAAAKAKSSEVDTDSAKNEGRAGNELGMDDDWGDESSSDGDDNGAALVAQAGDDDSSEDDGSGDGNYDLHNAVQNGSVEKIRYLLGAWRNNPLFAERKKEIEKREDIPIERRKIALHAIERDFMARFLARRDQDGCIPLHVAVLWRQLDCMKSLLDFGSSVEIACNNAPICHLILSVGSIREHQDFALKALDLVLAHKPKLSLVMKPVDINEVDDLHRTVLHLCAEFKFPSALKLLMKRTDLNDLWAKVDEEKLTCAHWACRIGSAEVLELILSAKKGRSVVKLKDLYGRNSLHFAAMSNFPAGIKMLMASYPELEKEKDLRGRTPADWANVCGSVDALKLLTGKGEKSSSSVGVKKETKNKKTLILSHEICSKHYTCPPKYTAGRKSSENVPPENVNRLKVLLHEELGILRSHRLDGCLEWQKATRANIADILRVHDYMYVQKVQEFAQQLEEEEIGELDGDTSISGLSFEAAMFAAGSVCDAIDSVCSSKHKNAFCAVRPPGHHAGPRGVVACPNDPAGSSYGFCLLSNAAIGAAYARNVYRHQGLKNVAIIDFDVHHGNGTEACVKNLVPSVMRSNFESPFCELSVSVPTYKPWLNEKDHEHVFFASAHGYGKRVPGLDPDPLAPPRVGMFYPSDGKNFGFGDFPKSEPGEPQIIDVGINSKSRVQWRTCWQKHILPSLAAFKPDLIIISAGFDAHRFDDINMGYISAVEYDYYWLTRELVKIANKFCKGRVVSILEGGYKIEGQIVSPFARSVCSHVSALVETSEHETYDLKDATWECTFEEAERARAEEEYLRKLEAGDGTGENGSNMSGEDSAHRKRSRRSTASQGVDYKALNEKLNEELKEAKKRKTEEAERVRR